VTDANLVLGYLNPARFCGGTMRLDVEGAHAAIDARVARPLGLSVVEAAHGIFQLVNANMANAVRKVSAGRGIDPRPITLVVFGGNGPVHAGPQAAELGIRRILVPKLSPAFSALGLLLTDPTVDEMRSYVSPVGRVDLARVNALLAEMTAAAQRALGPRARRLRVERLAVFCYPGQTFDMPVPLPARRGAVTPKVLADAVERFHAMHEALHTYASRDQEPVLRGLRVKASAAGDKPTLPRAPRRAPGLLRRPLRLDARLGRPGARSRPGDPRPGDRRGAVHDDRRLPRPARGRRPVGELRDRARVARRAPRRSAIASRRTTAPFRSVARVA